MALLVSDILYAAYRIAGILGAAGRGYSTEEETEGLKVLNSMIDSWKAERLMVYAILRSLQTITSAKQIYTIGTGGDFNIERPERIEMAYLIYTTTPAVEIPLQIYNTQQWAALTPKSMTGLLPTVLYYEPFTPLGNVNIWAIPTSTWQIALYLWQTVNQFALVGDPVILAPAYQEAIEYNLAVRLAERFPERQQIAGTSVQRAASALRKVKSINAPELLMQTESAARGTNEGSHYNIFSNRYN